MAYIKNPTEKQRMAWREANETLKADIKARILNLTQSWREHPETIAEMLEFGSRIYQYSMRNNMLIYSQNPYATYVQSFQAWKEMGASVKKGEKGIKVYVPVESTVLKIDGHLVPLEHATKEQKISYQAGEIESITQKKYMIGNVFDISQTTYPKEQYPKLYHMGYPSVLHAAVVNGLKTYAGQELDCPVKEENFQSISARGNYTPGYEKGEHRIRLNELLNDTEKLSTLAHGLGHALLHQDGGTLKTTVQKELEADALGIMIAGGFGLEITEGRQRHLAANYREYEKLYAEAEQNHELVPGFYEVLSNVFQVYKKESPILSEYVEKALKKEEALLIKQGVDISKHLKGEIGKPAQKIPEQDMAPDRQEIYDRMKQEIHVLDYAQSHGMEVQRVGRYYTIKGMDSIRIDPEKNCFWRNSGKGVTTTGSVIDFATAFVHNEDLHAALTELDGLVGGVQMSGSEAGKVRMPETKWKPRERKSLDESLPKRSKNMHRAYAYLTQTRFIEPEVVQHFVDRKMLYQDEKGNCVFVSYDEHKMPAFATLRGTLSGKKFVGDVGGCNYQRGFYIDNGADKLIVTESVIDAMSIMSVLYGQGMDYTQYDYLPLNGVTKHVPVLYHLAEQPKEQVLLALDNDLAGVKDMRELKDKLLDELSGLDLKAEQVTFHVPEAKDWNEELVSYMRKLRPVSEIAFLEGGALPEIRYCAVQSTKDVEELGFHVRNGQHQYRLVELTDQGEVQAVDYKRNIIFTDPKEVKKLVPELNGIYEEVSYKQLQDMQQVTEQSRAETPELPSRDPENGLLVKGFEIEESVIVARIVYEGVESKETVWKQGESYHVETGYEIDHTFQEHPFTKKQEEELETFLTEQEIVLDKDAPFLMLDQQAQGQNQGSMQKKDGTAFLDTLQKQQFQSQKINPAPEMTLGIGG